MKQEKRIHVSCQKKATNFTFLSGCWNEVRKKQQVRWLKLVVVLIGMKICVWNLTKIPRVYEKTKQSNCTLFTIYAHKSFSSFPGYSVNTKTTPLIVLFRTHCSLFFALASFHPGRLFAHFAPSSRPDNGKTMDFIFCQKLTPNTAMKQLNKQKAESRADMLNCINVWKLCIIMR